MTAVDPRDVDLDDVFGPANEDDAESARRMTGTAPTTTAQQADREAQARARRATANMVRAGAIERAKAAIPEDPPRRDDGMLAAVFGSEPHDATAPSPARLIEESRENVDAPPPWLDEAPDVEPETQTDGTPRIRIGTPALLTFPLSDTGNAERLVSLYGADLRYVPTWNKWLAWNGSRWVLEPRSGSVQRAAKKMVREFQKQAIGHPAEIKFAAASESSRARNAMVELAQHEKEVLAQHDDFDADPMILNVHNGAVDLRTGALRPHRRDALLTKMAPVNYDPAATCPRFDKFLTEIMGGDTELVTFLLAFLGYCLTGDTREHVLVFWHGKGGNGKSVLAEVLLHVLGPYAGKAAPDLLFRTEKTDRHPAEIADLHGLRLVFCNETAQGRAWDEARVKDVTGGDRIKARRMREDFWSFTPTHKLVVFGNHKPQIRTVDDGMRRRLRLVPFAVSFVGREDRTLLPALFSEAPGILRRLVEGCLTWQKSGLPEVNAVRAATDAYVRDEDTLGQFFDGECVFGVEAKVTRKDLRARYVQWCEERDERPVAAKVFTQALRDRDTCVIDHKVRGPDGPRDGWHGVRLRTEAERVVPDDVGHQRALPR